jgi:hypothetical protein
MVASSSTKLVCLISVLIAFLLATLYHVHTTEPFKLLSHPGELGDMPERAEVGVISSERIPSVRNSGFNRDLMPRILALYFPQYHRDPINDKNWGVNFTDWVLLLASPRLNKEGFEIPRPTKLGYYDLSHTEPRKRQGHLAKKMGLTGSSTITIGFMIGRIQNPIWRRRCLTC